MKSRLEYQRYKSKIFGLVAVGVLIILGYTISRFIPEKKTIKKEETFSFVHQEKQSSFQLEKFNPNNYQIEDWKKLGFSEKQAISILKYKNYLGGEFHSQEQLKECFVISDEKFSEIQPFLLLPEKSNVQKNEYSTPYKSTHYQTQKLSVQGKFNPNHYNQKQWEKLGFSEKQAKSILKYKNYLGGEFRSKQEIKECFVISDEKFKQIQPFISLPKQTRNETNTKINRPKIVYQKFDPNTLSAKDWEHLGFSEKQAKSILKYKNNYLKGSFKSLEEIKKCYMISDEKWEELKPYIVLKIEKNEPAKPKTDFHQIDLNSITYDQLVEFGFSPKAARSYIGFRKILGGFSNMPQILDTYHIDKKLAQKLINIGTLNTKKIKKYSLVDAPESWLKKHPYFKYSADKIIFYRTTHDKVTNEKIWNFLKTPPKYRQRMEMYLVD